MENNKISRSFLLNCFQEFINEVLKFRELILSNRNNNTVQEIQSTLMEFIFHKRDIAVEQGTLIEAGYKEISYIMCVFADEIFINLHWNDEWKKNNLEMQMFHTHVGGRKFFENLERFLNSNSVYKYDIGNAYLFSLGLGFRGKYRGIDDEGIIQNYKNKLFEEINNYDEIDLSESDLFPQSKKHTIVNISNTEKRSYQIWSMILNIIILSYISLSYIVWNVSIKKTHDLIYLSQKDIENVENI